MIQSIIGWATQEKSVIDAVGWQNAQLASDALKQAKALTYALRHDPMTALPAAISQVEVAATQMRIQLDLIGAGFQLDESSSQSEVVLDVPAQRKRCGMAVRLVIGDQDNDSHRLRQPDPGLVELMVKARVWLHRLTFGGQGIGVIAQEEREEKSWPLRPGRETRSGRKPAWMLGFRQRKGSHMERA